MKSNQKELLKKLADTLFDLTRECETDDSFLDEVVNLNIFAKDLMEAGNGIYEKIEK